MCLADHCHQVGRIVDYPLGIQQLAGIEQTLGEGGRHRNTPHPGGERCGNTCRRIFDHKALPGRRPDGARLASIPEVHVEIVYTKSFWEMDMSLVADPMDTFLARVAADGFQGTEMFLPLVTDPPQRVLELHEKHGLGHSIIDIITEGDSPGDHRASFDTAFDQALAFRPNLINSHTGRDIFSFGDNVALYRHAAARAADAGVALVHETHRFRPTYSAIETARSLDAVPELLLNADLSHWMVVHESDLTDQDATVAAALQRSRHIHARVGFEEGPQVNDPRAPEWTGHVDRHVELWQRIVDHCRAAKVATLAITPEFGPAPYVPTLPHTQTPVVDVWAVNVFMKDMLRERLV